MGKKGKQKNQVTTVEDEDPDGFDGMGALGDLFEDNEGPDNGGGQGPWGETADVWGIQPADSASNVNVNGGGAWSNQPQQQQQQQYQQQQHHQQQQHQHHQQQQHQQQQKGGKQAQAQAGAAGRMDPRHAAANAAAMAMQGHLQQMQAGSRHEQMLAQQLKMQQMQQIQQELAKAQHQLNNHQQQQQQQQQNGKGEGRGKKKNKNKGNDPWSGGGGGGGDGSRERGGGGGGGAWGAATAAAVESDPWGLGGGGGQAGAPDSWATARGGSQAGGGDPWGAGDKQNDNQGVWQQDGWGANANADDGGVWGNAEQGGRGGGTWGDQGQAGGGGGAWDAPVGAAQALQNALSQQGHRLSRAPTMAQSDSWRDWTQMSGGMDGGLHNNGRPKVTVTAPSADESRTVLSGKQQHSQILQSLFGAFKGGRQDNPGDQGKKGGKGEGKKGKKGKKQQTPYASPWHAINVIEEEPEEEFEEHYEGYDGYDGNNPDWYNTAQSGWNDPTYSMPSKAYALAGEGRDPVGMHHRQSPYMDIQFIESHGAALASARLALYNSQGRKARERIHWVFNPDKDERVSSLLTWIQQLSPQLGTFGLNKFLQGRERGALFVNAGFRPSHAPEQPAFDWLTYDQIHPTFDRTLQESIAYYDVNTQVLVFVFLLSKTGNSMAIWRRKILLSNNIRLTFGAQIAQAKAGLRKQYPIYLDENPEDVPPPAPAKDKKRRWFKFGK